VFEWKMDISMRCLKLFLLLAIGAFFAPVAAQNAGWPAESPDEWLLAFIDVETTGLIPGHHEMIDIGIVMTDLEGSELGELFVRIQPEHPERTQDGARAVNAFDETRWKELGALTSAEAVVAISEFHVRIAGEKSVLMVAFNSHFDAAFMDHLFRSGGGQWRDLYHYFILDLPSMAWSKGLRGLTGQSLSSKLGIEDEPHVAELHTGITGAKLNARIYRALLKHRPE
jgi:DNA polymerase III alpha subunit (gram-positive type)